MVGGNSVGPQQYSLPVEAPYRERARKICEDVRAAAYNRMVEEACSLGANAVLGMRYEAHNIAEGTTEILCYGTAVVLKRGQVHAELGMGGARA